MILAISILIGQTLTRQQVAELACYVEIDKMGMPIGKQDQYASAFGGLNKITFSGEGVTVEPIKIAPDVERTLARRVMLFFTARSLQSTTTLQHHPKSIHAPPNPLH